VVRILGERVERSAGTRRRRAWRRGGWRIARFAVTVTAGALVLAGLALAATSGRYGGTTSQSAGGVHDRISFAVSHATVASLQVDATVAKGGGDCAVLHEGGSNFQFLGSLRITHNVFNGNLRDEFKDSIAIRGRFKGTTASGSFVITGDGGTVQPLICNSGTVRFTAKLPGGEVKDLKYSGSSGPGFPLSFRVSGSGKSVDDLVVLFDETCTPGAGNSDETFKFGPVRIVSGRFSTSADTVGGAGTEQSLSAKGEFFGRTAVGTVTDHVTITSLTPCTETVPLMATGK
jgi:hypothetical protein